MNSYAIIYFNGTFPKDVDRDDIEDALEVAFKDFGEVTGAGSSINGSDLVVDFDETKLSPEKSFKLIEKVLNKFNLSIPITINIGRLYDLNNGNKSE